MADIFISYAQKAPEPTKALAADLARLKYEYWFDERLLPVDVFGQVINERIDQARAVITIWSQPALKSRWVYAEALRADDQGKLLNVHTLEVRPGSIPVPFNAGHISPIENRTSIYEALSRLGVYPSGFAPIDRVARAFEYIEKSTDIEDFEAFLADFASEGKQFYIRLAKKKIAELSARRGGITIIGAAVITEKGDTLEATGVTAAEVPLPQAVDVFLRIEPGMHTAPLRRIGVNAASTILVTGSDDKTARVWELPEGASGAPKLLRTLRVPINEGDDGKIFAVALSPDGKWAVAGGSETGVRPHRIGAAYVFETTSGRLVARLGPLGNAITHLTFSPDGSRLAAMLVGGEGMRLWETGAWQLLAEDKDYSGKDSYGAAFDNANRLYGVCDDGQLRRYGADGHLEARERAQGGSEPFSVAVHPRHGKLVLGFYDSSAVEVYDGQTLKRLYAADTSGILKGNLNSVAWSANGSQLYACGNGKIPAMMWLDEGRGKRSEITLWQTTISQLLPCGKGVLVGTDDSAFGLIASDGGKRFWQEGVTANMRGKLHEAFTLFENGKRIRFGLGQGAEEAVLFDLAAFSLNDAPQLGRDLSVAKIWGLPVTEWEDTVAPKLNGSPIELEAYERSRALAIAPDASCFVLGTTCWLRAYRGDGHSLWQKTIPGFAWGVNISGNGKLVAAAYGDGTIRWYRMADGEELLALFVHAKDRRYIAWTPKGYYAASPGAEDLIGWHVNRGFDAAPDFYPASTFASTFNRPDIVKAALDV